MKKVTDLGENEVIHCPTLEEAEAICKLMHEAGLKWSSGDYYIETNNWDEYREDTCYTPLEEGYASKEYFISEGYTIHPASDFIEQQNTTLKAGDKVVLCGMEHVVIESFRNGYYVGCFNYANDTVFKQLGVDKYNFHEKILGYKDDYIKFDDFPRCKTLEDLTKFVNAIKEIEQQQNTKPEMENKTFTVTRSQLKELAKEMDGTTLSEIAVRFIDVFESEGKITLEQIKNYISQYPEEIVFIERIFPDAVIFPPHGTMCWVRNKGEINFDVKPSDGKGKFYFNQDCTGIQLSYEEWIVDERLTPPTL